jgi:hypothetical protein
VCHHYRVQGQLAAELETRAVRRLSNEDPDRLLYNRFGVFMYGGEPFEDLFRHRGAVQVRWH